MRRTLRVESGQIQCGVPFEKHLLVDGSNLLHAWPELRRLERRDRDTARGRLLHAVRLLHDMERLRVTVVFDGKGAEARVEHPSGEDTLTQIFSPGHLTADDVIEHLVAQAIDPAQCLVATDDRAERMTVETAGGTCCSCADLAQWIDRVAARQQAKLSGLKRLNNEEWRRNK